MLPPPCEWHPLQFCCSKSCWPWLMAQAFPSYGFLSETIERWDSVAPAVMERVSRWQPRAQRMIRAQRTSRQECLLSTWSADILVCARLHTGHPVRIENPVDVGTPPFDLGVEAVTEFRVAAAHAHRDVEDEGEER